MPTFSPSLTVEYSFSNATLNPAEQQRQIALQAIDDMKGLFLILANLTCARIVERLTGTTDPQRIEMQDVAELNRRVAAFDAGVNVLGHLGAAIGDTAYGAVEELFIARTEAPKAKARKGGAR